MPNTTCMLWTHKGKRSKVSNFFSTDRENHSVFTDYMFHFTHSGNKKSFLIVEVKRKDISCHIGPTKAFAHVSFSSRQKKKTTTVVEYD